MAVRGGEENKRCLGRTIGNGQRLFLGTEIRIGACEKKTPCNFCFIDSDSFSLLVVKLLAL